MMWAVPDSWTALEQVHLTALFLYPVLRGHDKFGRKTASVTAAHLEFAADP